MRMYARGAADDKAGVIVHTAAISTWLETTQSLPVNVKVIVEGEEETGSDHLFEFLSSHKQKLDADVMVLTDTANFDCGIPSLTVALRGILVCEVELRSLDNTVHSGMWGGPVPDPAMGLSKLLATLTDSQGRIAIDGVRDMNPALTPEEEAEFAKLPWNEARFREQVGMRPGVQLIGGKSSPFVQMWREPNLSINAIQASSREQAGNVINDCAWARISIRVAPGMDAQKVQAKLQEHLQKHVPWGLEMKLQVMDQPVNGWMTRPEGPAFDAARKCLREGFGEDSVIMGCGGPFPLSSPLVKPLGIFRPS